MWGLLDKLEAIFLSQRSQDRHGTKESRHRQTGKTNKELASSLNSGVCRSCSPGRRRGSVWVSRGGLASVGRSSKVSFASANETEPGWPVSPWQQAISTSLPATLAAMVVCLLVSLHPSSFIPSSLHCSSHQPTLSPKSNVFMLSV